MSPQIWLENLAAYSVQVAVLILAAGVLIELLQIKVPAVLLAFWQILVGICLLLPAVQPWRHEVIHIAQTQAVDPRLPDGAAATHFSRP